MHSIGWMALVGTLAGLTACASDSITANDPYPAPYPWCADEARAAASQPISKDASREEREAMRDYHMSKACQKALEQKVEVSFPAKSTKD